MNEKCTVKPTECESTAQCKKQMFYEHVPYENGSVMRASEY